MADASQGVTSTTQSNPAGGGIGDSPANANGMENSGGSEFASGGETSSGNSEKNIPYARFQESRQELKQAKSELAQFRAQFGQYQQQMNEYIAQLRAQVDEHGQFRQNLAETISGKKHNEPVYEDPLEKELNLTKQQLAEMKAQMDEIRQFREQREVQDRAAQTLKAINQAVKAKGFEDSELARDMIVQTWHANPKASLSQVVDYVHGRLNKYSEGIKSKFAPKPKPSLRGGGIAQPNASPIRGIADAKRQALQMISEE